MVSFTVMLCDLQSRHESSVSCPLITSLRNQNVSNKMELIYTLQNGTVPLVNVGIVPSNAFQLHVSAVSTHTEN